jgi:predicted TPR repeat methyltransferase
LGYVVPGLLAALLKSAPRQSFKTAIDLGCGTGLMATKVRAQINHLTGVDLSAAMLVKAQDKALYDVLQKADITAALNGATQYDLIMAADVFMYIPDLCPAFQAIAQSMTEDGLFLFSIEKQAGPHPWKLLESMRHAHAPSYIEHLLAQQNLTILRQQEATIRMDRGQPIAGVLFLAQRHGSTHAA